MSAVLSPVTSIVSDMVSGRTSTSAHITAVLENIKAVNPRVNAFTDILDERALAVAAGIDRRKAAGQKLGALAGVPFAVKNMIDVAGLRTRAGSKINSEERAPAKRDATLVRRLEAADAILVGTLNMGEYAYDFTGENAHYGPSRNPHALDHMTGGSSGGSGAAVAAGMVPISLGSDTNGSIRIPSTFCGIFGLKPTYGRLSRFGSFPFVSSLDVLGPIARSVDDLALCYDVMQGSDQEDPVSCCRDVEPTSRLLDRGVEGLRIATAVGHFSRNSEPEVLQAVGRVAQSLDVRRQIEIPEAQRARAAAQVISAAEGAALHLDRLRAQANNYDPIVRDRLLAGAATPAAWVIKAQQFRRWYKDQVLQLFKSVDVILAPATPCRAPKIGQQVLDIEGETVPLRPALGIFTQPISFIGLPVVTVPIWIDGGLPLGVQIITAPWREDLGLRVASYLERAGTCKGLSS